MNATDKGLIFRNLLNGVPEWKLAEDFRTSVEDVQKAFLFVLRKAKSYCFERQTTEGYQPVLASDVKGAQKERLTLLAVLPNLNLDKDPTFKDIHHEAVTPDNLGSLRRNFA